LPQDGELYIKIIDLVWRLFGIFKGNCIAKLQYKA